MDKGGNVAIGVRLQDASGGALLSVVVSPGARSSPSPVAEVVSTSACCLQTVLRATGSQEAWAFALGVHYLHHLVVGHLTKDIVMLQVIPRQVRPEVQQSLSLITRIAHIAMASGCLPAQQRLARLPVESSNDWAVPPRTCGLHLCPLQQTFLFH